MKARLYFASFVTALAFFASWLISGASSPLREYIFRQEAVRHWWAVANAAPALIADAVAITLRGRGGELIYLALFTAQWFAFGYLAASPAAALRRWFWKPIR